MTGFQHRPSGEKTVGMCGERDQVVLGLLYAVLDIISSVPNKVPYVWARVALTLKYSENRVSPGIQHVDILDSGE